MHTLALRAYLALLTAVRALTARPAGPTMRRVAAARGVTFIEYAMLGATAVFIGWLFREQLGDAFDSLLGNIRGGLDDAAQTG